MGKLKSLAGQTVIYGLSSIIPRFFNYLLVPLYTRLFLPAEYGVVTELYAYVIFLIIILTYGFETGFFRFSVNHDQKDTVYSTAFLSLFISSVIFIIITSVFFKSIATGIGYKSHPEYVFWFGLILGLDAITAIPFAKLRYENKAFRFAILKFINVGVNLVSNLTFLVFLPSFTHFKIDIEYIFISNFIASLCTLIIFIPEFYRIKFKFSIKIYKELLNYSIPLLFAGLAGSINEALDRVLLKHLISGTTNPLYQLGIYGANFKLAVIMVLFIQAFRYAAEPFFFKESDQSDSKNTYGRVMKFFVIFCLFIFLLVTQYISVFKYFIGKNYWEGLGIVPILLISYIFYGMFFNLSIWYKLTNKTHFGAYLSIFGSIITLVLNIIYIPKYGYYASAWIHVICYLFMLISSYFLMRKYYYINYNLPGIFIYFILTGSLYTIGLFFDNLTFFVSLLFHSIILVCFIIFVFYKENLFKEIKIYARKNS